MAKKKLFKTAKELFEGYGLPTPTQGKRGRKAGASDNKKVLLRARQLPSGNVQLFLYSCFKGKPTRFSVGILNPETDEQAKARNVEIMRMAEAEAGIRKCRCNQTGARLGASAEKKRPSF